VSAGAYIEEGHEATLSFITPLGVNRRKSYLWFRGTSFDGTRDEGGLVHGVSVGDAFVDVAGKVNILATDFSVSDGLFSGGGTLVVGDDSKLDWSKGTADDITIEVAAGHDLGLGGTLNLEGGTLKENATILNNNVATLQFGDFNLETGATIRNGSTGSFSILDDSSLTGDSTRVRFINELGGVMTKSGGTGVSRLDKLSFTNQGTLEVRSGTLKIPKDAQRRGMEVLRGGKLNTDGLLTLAGGILANLGPSAQNGEVFGDVVNTGGEVQPGGSGTTGILTIDGTNGTYTQSGKGALDIDLQNPIPGTGSDQLVVTGAVTLGGALNVNPLPGFTGNSFTILRDAGPAPVKGQFAGLPEGATLALAGRPFRITYRGGLGGQDVVLNAVIPIFLPTTTTVTASVNPSVFGQAVTFTATVAPTTPGGVPTGSVQFQVDGTNFGAPVSLAAGTATSGSIATLSPGPHTVVAVYSGDTIYRTSTGTVTQTVNQAGTAVRVSSADPSAVYGESLTFTATVATTSPGAGAPTGMVAFKKMLPNGTAITLGTGTLDATGTAVFQMPNGLVVASHTIFAMYLGDTNFASSTSATITQVVNPAATTLMLTADTQTIVLGQPVHYTIQLNPVPPGSFVTNPTGTVTLYDTFGGVTTALATLTLGGPPVNFPVFNQIGVHALTAVYSGDANFNGCTSAELDITVNPPPT
jgi:hypothetical protein